jgi:hypothetical protein
MPPAPAPAPAAAASAAAGGPLPPLPPPILFPRRGRRKRGAEQEVDDKNTRKKSFMNKKKVRPNLQVIEHVWGLSFVFCKWRREKR